MGLIDLDSNKEFVVYTDLLKLRDREDSVEIIGNGKLEIYQKYYLKKVVPNRKRSFLLGLLSVEGFTGVVGGPLFFVLVHE